MIIFRPHRGSLSEAMSEAKEFENEEAMRKYISMDWCKIAQDYILPEDIVIEKETINDDRNGWEDTMYVCTNRFGDQDCIELYGCPQCIGMCATKYPKITSK